MYWLYFLLALLVALGAIWAIWWPLVTVLLLTAFFVAVTARPWG